jgi:hypothetical protein
MNDPRQRTREITNKIREVLMSQWDPIGVADIPEAADEYDMYIGGVFGLLARRASPEDVCAYLRRIEVERMELVDADGEPFMATERRMAVVESLKRLDISIP